MARDTLTIEVKDPATGKSVKWMPMNEKSALHQAQIEADRGATVTVRCGDKIIWTNKKTA